MKRVLVAYATMAGSTAEVAKAVSDALTEQGLETDLQPIANTEQLQGYDAVVVGGPMILGWHREARRFLRENSTALETKPFALFAMAMSLTSSGEDLIEGVPVFIDQKLANPPKDPLKQSMRERYTSHSNYIRPMLRSSQPAKPVSIAIFGGRLSYGRLKWWAVLFALLIVRAEAGDKRNWESIREWARSLPELMWD